MSIKIEYITLINDTVFKVGKILGETYNVIIFVDVETDRKIVVKKDAIAWMDIGSEIQEEKI